ncbi:MAG: hypothetical protein K0R38_4451 [Polyangiaceae bacterium]|jgi:hypothetical protein|nr:hypothetical protein [Polyangiaceae bacterium]
MSHRSIRQTLVVAFALSLSSLALARNPPALVAQQQATEHATRSAGGYRDMNERFGVVAERAPATRIGSGGYRDIHVRFPASMNARETASTQTTTSVR